MSCLTLRSRSGRADRPAEVLRDDDVGGLLRPELRDLDVALLEDDLALLVADDGRADVPLDLVERIDALSSKEAVVLQTWSRSTYSTPTGEPGLLCWWIPPAAQRLSASSPPETRESPASPWPGPARTTVNGWARANGTSTGFERPCDVPPRAGKTSFGPLRRRTIWTLFTRMSRVDLQDIVLFI